MHDHSVSSWINVRGETIFEMAMAGVLITYKEEKERAKRFLSEASLNKTDLILDYSLVRTDNPIPCPRKATYLKISLDGVSDQLPLLPGPGQKVEETKVKGGVVAVYRLRSGLNRYSKVTEASSHKDDLQKYLASSNHIESDDPEIKKVANEIVTGAKTPLDRVRHIVTWVSDEVEDEMTESVSARQVLHQRKGECQAHTMLYTALARAEGIPTRLVGGLVYMEDMGFLYHSWAESYIDGWIAVDPTFDQVGVDATHIKLVEGDSWLSTLKVGKVIGRVKAEVIDFQVPCQKSESKQ
jgi:transglutaminase-like putative cysteine protease